MFLTHLEPSGSHNSHIITMELGDGDGDGGRKGTPSNDSSLKVNPGAERISILKKWLGTVEFLYQTGLDISKGEWKY